MFVMKYFDDEFNKFFKELESNNSREWFNDNKKRYEVSIKMPFQVLISDLIEMINKEIEPIQITQKQAIFKIYRDTRFSKNKLPIKEFLSAIVGPKGLTDKEYPGLHIRFTSDFVWLFGGCYKLDKIRLDKIRWFIMENPERLNEILDNEDFKSHFGSLFGEKNKVIRKEFRESAATLPLLYNKQFIYQTNLPNNLITSELLLPTLVKYYKYSLAIQHFLIEAIEV